MTAYGAHGAATPAAPQTLGLWPRFRDDRLLVAVLGTLVLLAWLTLWLWEGSRYGRFLGHEEIGTSQHGYALLLAFFLTGWTLMTVAMMLPTSLPLVAFFHSFVRARPDRGVLVVLLVLGYVLVWIAFAVLVHLGDIAVHATVERFGWLEANAWTVAALTFLGAGVYQFSGIKHRCLDKCRSPVGFVVGNWQGRGSRREALGLGARHGLFCLGCCWSLMLVMFAVGVGSLAWMLMLAAVMATEKNVAWGWRLSGPVGALLIVCAAVIAITEMAGFAS